MGLLLFVSSAEAMDRTLHRLFRWKAQEIMSPKIGSQRWWEKEFISGPRGIIHAIMILVFDHRITPKKGVEMVDQLRKKGRGGKVPPAPWADVRW